MKIKLKINRLVLKGLPSTNSEALQAAVRRELTRLLAENGLPGALQNGGRRTRLHGGKFEMGQEQGARKIGAHIANGIYTGMKS